MDTIKGMTEQAAVETTNRIEVYVDGSGWVARYSGPHAAEIVRLFGVDTLPLPWSSVAEGGVVLHDVEQRNPGVICFL